MREPLASALTSSLQISLSPCRSQPFVVPDLPESISASAAVPKSLASTFYPLGGIDLVPGSNNVK